jgi:hypothetical protein
MDRSHPAGPDLSDSKHAGSFAAPHMEQMFRRQLKWNAVERLAFARGTDILLPEYPDRDS